MVRTATKDRITHVEEFVNHCPSDEPKVGRDELFIGERKKAENKI